MQIIPVLDVMKGAVVRGVAGRRAEYWPITSQLVDSSEPLTVARAFRERFGLTYLYVADLDAIGGGEPDRALYETLQGDGFGLWVDAGVRNWERAVTLAGAGVRGVVVGLETLTGPDMLEHACQVLGKRVIFSLDLKAGTPLGDLRAWRHRDAWSIASSAVALGVKRLLVLDLTRVGVASGTGTDELCMRIATEFPSVKLYAGGGVRGVEDLLQLRECGVKKALVASALHDGRLTKADLDRL